MDDRTEHSEDESTRDREGRGLHSEDDPIAMLTAMQRQHEAIQRQMIEALVQRAEEVSRVERMTEETIFAIPVMTEVLRFICPTCGKDQPVPNGTAPGSVIACPSCQNAVRVVDDAQALSPQDTERERVNATARRLLDF